MLIMLTDFCMYQFNRIRLVGYIVYFLGIDSKQQLYAYINEHIYLIER